MIYNKKHYNTIYVKLKTIHITPLHFFLYHHTSTQFYMSFSKMSETTFTKIKYTIFPEMPVTTFKISVKYKDTHI